MDKNGTNWDFGRGWNFKPQFSGQTLLSILRANLAEAERQLTEKMDYYDGCIDHGVPAAGLSHLKTEIDSLTEVYENLVTAVQDLEAGPMPSPECR